MYADVDCYSSQVMFLHSFLKVSIFRESQKKEILFWKGKETKKSKLLFSDIHTTPPLNGKM